MAHFFGENCTIIVQTMKIAKTLVMAPTADHNI